MLLSVPLRVFGVGDGIVVIAIAILFSLCLCFFGAKSTRPV